MKRYTYADIESCPIFWLLLKCQQQSELFSYFKAKAGAMYYLLLFPLSSDCFEYSESFAAPHGFKQFAFHLFKKCFYCFDRYCIPSAIHFSQNIHLFIFLFRHDQRLFICFVVHFHLFHLCFISFQSFLASWINVFLSKFCSCQKWVCSLGFFFKYVAIRIKTCY